MVKIEIKNLKVWFPVRTSFLKSLYSKKHQYSHAVDGVSFKIKEEEIFCLAGESGCGKTTLAKAMIRLIKPTSGTVRYSGVDLLSIGKNEFRSYRRKLQIIYQDPYSSLNPKKNVFNTIAEPLKVHNFIKNFSEGKDIITQILEEVELTPAESFFGKYPHELSGGQRQRVSIASSLVLNPDFIVADEPVSMLDSSVRTEVLYMMLRLKKKRKLTYLFITHDLSLAWLISDRIAIMYLGKIVEMGPTDEVVSNPQHPYTKALISVIPRPTSGVKHKKIILKGNPPDSMNIPAGCRFHPRCFEAKDICKRAEPSIVKFNKNHYVACHLLSQKRKP